MSEENTITLQFPLKHGDEEIHELTFRPVNMKTLRVLDSAKGEINQTVRLIAAITRLPPSAIDTMDARDLDAVNEAMIPFLPASLRTGGSVPEL